MQGSATDIRSHSIHLIKFAATLVAQCVSQPTPDIAQARSQCHASAEPMKR